MIKIIVRKKHFLSINFFKHLILIRIYFLYVTDQQNSTVMLIVTISSIFLIIKVIDLWYIKNRYSHKTYCILYILRFLNFMLSIYFISLLFRIWLKIFFDNIFFSVTYQNTFWKIFFLANNLIVKMNDDFIYLIYRVNIQNDESWLNLDYIYPVFPGSWNILKTCKNIVDKHFVDKKKNIRIKF